MVLEQKNAERDELFGDRSYIENRTRGQRNVAFQIRHAVGLEKVEKVTILDDGNDGAGSFASVPSRKESVHSLSTRILGDRVGRWAQQKRIAATSEIGRLGNATRMLNSIFPAIRRAAED